MTGNDDVSTLPPSLSAQDFAALDPVLYARYSFRHFDNIQSKDLTKITAKIRGYKNQNLWILYLH